ncbi:hypothetical protein CAI16_13420 [Virgibacillus dokdonensis]|uniref:Uncharacterized protein n=1 Tax=Virgibacillus dokdonensis TaxID=302167 RepID=A0A3E0WN61_9BACI|nr:hypothetical protein [Virgibacillus dokdonensis]RFA33849.1 hypothetical protein CAI16_13420 [Virgibacillus dokdonensis]
MLKTRNDFQNEDEYRKYTKSGDFLCQYVWKGKSRDQIIYDMALPNYEQAHLDEAMKNCDILNEHLGVELDRMILYLIDKNAPEDDFDPDEVLYIKRKQ